MGRLNSYDLSDFTDIITGQDVGNSGKHAGRLNNTSFVVNQALCGYSKRVADLS